MADSRKRADPELVEAIARRVVVLLEENGVRQPEKVGAAELARRLGVDRSWVYAHAIELGAVKLGDGPKARLRFDPEVAERTLKKVGKGPATDPPAHPSGRADRPRSARGNERRGRDFPLLPFREEDGPSTVA